MPRWQGDVYDTFCNGSQVADMYIVAMQEEIENYYDGYGWMMNGFQQM